MPKAARASKSSPLPSPSEVRRRVSEALASVRGAEFGSALGLLHVEGQIGNAQFEAGKRWGSLTASYNEATLSPRQPRSASFDAGGGQPPDPDSERGQQEVRRNQRTIAAYSQALNALRRAGVERVTSGVCVHDRAPTNPRELAALCEGLTQLARLFSERRHTTAR